MEKTLERRPGRGSTLFKMVSLSLIGIVIFFVELPIAGTATILPVHIANAIVDHARPAAIAFVLLLILYGALAPFLDGSWRKSWGSMVFSAFKVLGLIATVAYLAGFAPAVITSPGMMPFLFEKLVLNLGLIVPIGAIGLSFLICYGLIEFCSVFLEPVMRRIWRTPGYSAVDAVASFVGSYSIGLLITNRMFLTRSYSFRQAVIIATGFSTISVTFMVVVAKVLGLLSIWNYYFWSTLLVTFAVTAITARIPPISWYDDTEDGHQEDDVAATGYFAAAMQAALTRVEGNPGFLRLLWENVKDGLKMTSVILPTGVSVGLLGLLLSMYTPVFDWLGLLFYPLLSLLQVPEAMLTAKAMAAALAEMFFPTGMLTDAPMMSRYLFGVTSVSGLLFFAGSIPCILATEIPVKVPHLVLIWAIRVLLSIPLAVAAAHLGPVIV
ncbi:YjiH family protein [Paracoccus sp. Z330]|uniref:YjiH family protein n=1 Tax=Paracoccus onchidii TaxID=3017813 RepID=A0ABT4ZA24_9RHOB|nr:YjiH family protein [Paracoccus onchidii]MDB6176199.1 YjiH family protein [Paracoccus onchidii]